MTEAATATTPTFWRNSYERGRGVRRRRLKQECKPVFTWSLISGFSDVNTSGHISSRLPTECKLAVQWGLGNDLLAYLQRKILHSLENKRSTFQKGGRDFAKGKKKTTDLI